MLIEQYTHSQIRAERVTSDFSIQGEYMEFRHSYISEVKGNEKIELIICWFDIFISGESAGFARLDVPIWGKKGETTACFEAQRVGNFPPTTTYTIDRKNNTHKSGHWWLFLSSKTEVLTPILLDFEQQHIKSTALQHKQISKVFQSPK